LPVAKYFFEHIFALFPSGQQKPFASRAEAHWQLLFVLQSEANPSTRIPADIPGASAKAEGTQHSNARKAQKHRNKEKSLLRCFR